MQITWRMSPYLKSEMVFFALRGRKKKKKTHTHTHTNTQAIQDNYVSQNKPKLLHFTKRDKA